MLDVAWGHQDAGRPIYIVTAASQEIAELLAQVLVFDGGIGMRSEIQDGFYTGRPDGPFTYREGKAEAIRQVAEREGIDLSESWAYSDSESDLPMLRAVGHPVAVNPDQRLLRVAREEGWQVMTFDRLRRRLRLVGAAAALGAVGAGSGYVAARARPSRRRRAGRVVGR
jgi:phosphoserine phosphatase